MSWVTPSSTVKILHGVPFDNSYENTFYSNNAVHQYNNFDTFTKYTFALPPAAMTYQRVNKNTIRVNVDADHLYDCNYLMFQNTAYGNKWFYAFINQVNYINDNISEIVYEIDDIQTWFHDITFEQCFIERQHQAGDAIGDNIVPENINVGEYQIKTFEVPSQLLKSNCKIVLSSSLKEGSPDVFVEAGGGLYRSIYSGCDYLVFDNSVQGISDLEDYIESLYRIFADRSNSVVNLFMCPEFLITQKNSNSYTTPMIKMAKPTNPNGGDGRISVSGVRNNKLLTYPYTFLYVTNFQGLGKAYPYEYFQYSFIDENSNLDTSNVGFILNGDYTSSPCVTLTPINYKEGRPTGSANQLNKDEIITSGKYPQCTFNTDSYKAWLAQTAGLGIIALGAVAAGAGLGALGVAGAAKAAFDYNTAQSLPTSGTDLMTTTQWMPPTQPQPNAAVNIANRGLSAMKNAGTALKPAILDATKNVLRSGYDAFINPIHQRGNQSDAALFVSDAIGFGFAMKQILPRELSRLDDYFTMYGYAQNIVDVPQRKVRNEWTYVKTVGCSVRGYLPVDAQRHINEIHDAGIRYWTDITKVGLYNRNNTTPTSSNSTATGD